MRENLAKFEALVRHSNCSGLAQTDSMSLPNAFDNQLRATPRHSEVVALNRAPSQPAIDCQSRRFIGAPQRNCIGRSNLTAPASGVISAVFALNRIVGIFATRHANISRRTSVSTATARVHCREGFCVISDYKATSLCARIERGSADCRRLS